MSYSWCSTKTSLSSWKSKRNHRTTSKQQFSHRSKKNHCLFDKQITEGNACAFGNWNVSICQEVDDVYSRPMRKSSRSCWMHRNRYRVSLACHMGPKRHFYWISLDFLHFSELRRVVVSIWLFMVVAFAIVHMQNCLIVMSLTNDVPFRCTTDWHRTPCTVEHPNRHHSNEIMPSVTWSDH